MHMINTPEAVHQPAECFFFRREEDRHIRSQSRVILIQWQR